MECPRFKLTRFVGGNIQLHFLGISCLVKHTVKSCLSFISPENLELFMHARLLEKLVEN
jgi:hypothetical protein